MEPEMEQMGRLDRDPPRAVVASLREEIRDLRDNLKLASSVAKKMVIEAVSIEKSK